MSVTLICRPIERWPGQLRTDSQRRALPFRATWTDTVGLLELELGMLGVTSAVVQLAVVERDCRRDGWIRADAKPKHPGVIVSFDHPTHGPLSYPCDTFAGGSKFIPNRERDGDPSEWKSRYRDVPGWQANVRAIALGLEALRKVDRYGIAGHGEQYTGWRQLGAGLAMPPAAMTVEEAARFVATHAYPNDVDRADLLDDDVRTIIDDPELVRKEAFRLAAKRLHPDVGGDVELFKRLEQAKQIIEAAS